MLEVVFSDSAAGSLKLAMGGGNHLGGAGAVGVLLSGDGGKPDKKELRKARREAVERERRNWAQAIPLAGSRKDVLAFPLALSVGSVDEEGIGPKREAALTRLMGIYPGAGEDAAKELAETSRRSLSTLLAHAGEGEPVRVWTGRNPDEACGLCWLMEQLRPIGLEKLEITLVTLPEFEERPDGVVVRYTGWGEIEPHQWGAMAESGKRLPGVLARELAGCWKRLQAENAPLRAVLNGRLVSAPESLYDFSILRELEQESGEFSEAQVVGRVLGKYRLGIGDAWVADRIGQFVRDGLLEPVTQPEQDAPAYRRMLRWREAEKERILSR